MLFGKRTYKFYPSLLRENLTILKISDHYYLWVGSGMGSCVGPNKLRVAQTVGLFVPLTTTQGLESL